MKTYQIFLRKSKQDHAEGRLGTSLIVEGTTLLVESGWITIKRKSEVVFSIGPGLWEIVSLAGAFVARKVQ